MTITKDSLKDSLSEKIFWHFAKGDRSLEERQRNFPKGLEVNFLPESIIVKELQSGRMFKISIKEADPLV